MKTKLIFTIIALFVAITSAQASAFIDGLYYNLDATTQTAEVTYNYNDWRNQFYVSGDLVIPSSVNCSGITYSVTSIGYEAFYGCSSLTSITIPNSVTSIGSSAFSGCSNLPVIDNVRYADTYLVEAVDKNLSTYNIKSGTRWIGYEAFSGCSSLTSITIPNSVTSIGYEAFYKCYSLTSITIPNSVTSIGSSAFSGCTSLTSITIPNSVTDIGSDAFDLVPNIEYHGTATWAYYSEYWGARSMNGFVDGYMVYSDNSKTTLLACSSAVTGEIKIPNIVTSIGDGAFSGCSSLTSVTIPNSVTSIGYETFTYFLKLFPSNHSLGYIQTENFCCQLEH